MWPCWRATAANVSGNRCWPWWRTSHASAAPASSTLEVLSGNTGAEKLYRRVGFAYYELDPAMGQAGFMQKRLD